MNWTIPGTVLTIQRENAGNVRQVFESMFLPGGMVLSQVAGITGLEAYTIQNWVKRGFLTSPVQKRYSMRQLCRIINIHMLKNVLPMEKICGLLGYINGQLDNEADDMIDDSQLYFMFVELASQASAGHNRQEWEALIDIALADYQEPIPGAKERVSKVLCIMLTAWFSARLHQAANQMLLELT